MRDLRRYARQTNVRLMIGFILVLLVVGDSLIFLFYGREAWLMGLVCIGLGLAPLIIIFLVLWLIEWVVQKVNNQ